MVMESVNPEFDVLHSKHGCHMPDPVLFCRPYFLQALARSIKIQGIFVLSLLS